MVGKKTIRIDASIFTALTSLGLPHTVNGLIALANRAIADMTTGGATLSTIHAAVSSINEGFDECATLIFCGEVPPVTNRGTAGAAGVTNSEVPDDYVLDQNYPNPFNASTSISYGISEEGQVELAIFNVLGQRVATLVNEHRAAGSYNVTWTATDGRGQSVASGMYLYRLTTAAGTQTKRMVLLK